MNKLNYTELQLNIYNRYKELYSFKFISEGLPYCILNTKEIYLNIRDWLEPNARTVFDILHEIGHLETNTYKMKRCEEEYYATVWAINESYKLKLKISEEDKVLFQDYIWNLIDKAIKLHAKNVPSKEELTLKW